MKHEKELVILGIDLRGLGVKEGYREHGEITITDQLISPSSDWTYETTLSRSDYKMGNLLLYIPNGVAIGTDRLVAFIMFTDDADEGISMAGGTETHTIVGYYGLPYYFDNWYHKGYKASEDSYLSTRFWYAKTATGGGPFSSQVYIKRVWIDANNLKITFTNTHGTGNGYVTVKGRYYVFT